MKYKYLTREYETRADVKKHFKELSKKYHPDMGGTDRKNDKLLKDLGFFWSSKHSKYYYSGKTKKVTKCSSYSMQDMRNMMGNKKIAKKEKEERLAIR